MLVRSLQIWTQDLGLTVMGVLSMFCYIKVADDTQKSQNLDPKFGTDCNGFLSKICHVMVPLLSNKCFIKCFFGPKYFLTSG